MAVWGGRGSHPLWRPLGTWLPAPACKGKRAAAAAWDAVLLGAPKAAREMSVSVGPL